MERQSQLAVDVKSTDLASVVSVRGSIDISTTGELEVAMRAAEAQPAPVIVDLTEVDFIDSSGLRVLILSTERLNASERRLSLVFVKGPVQRLFELAALTTSFSIHPDLASAQAAVREDLNQG